MKALASLFAFASLAAAPAYALEEGDWTIRAGATGVYTDIDSDPLITGNAGTLQGTAAGPDDAWSLGLTFGYAVTDHIGFELLAAWPFTHDIEANDALRQTLQDAGLAGTKVVGETKQLPPTLSLVYTFQPDESFRPYVGAGGNFFWTHDEKVKGDLETAGYTELDIENSYGIALQAGFDMDVSDNFFLNAHVRWLDVDVDARASGGALGSIDIEDIAIDPLVFSVMLGWTL